MATFDVAFKQRTQGVVVLSTFVPTTVQIGDSITVAAVGDGMDGTFDVISTQPYELVDVDEWGNLIFDYAAIVQNQLLYLDAGDAVERQAADTGTITYTESVQWIAAGDVQEWLGIEPSTGADSDFISTCTAAANAWAYRKRKEAGFLDEMATAPDPAAKLGTTMFAAMMYRERGAIDGYASFDGFGTGAPTMSIGRIMQLLGCGKAQVG